MTSSTSDQASVEKVLIVFRGVGGAPILAQPKVKISSSDSFSKVVNFLRKQVGQPVFCYLRDSFTPAFDDSIDTLVKAYGVDKSLTVNYSLTPAFG